MEENGAMAGMTKITAVRNFHARWPASTIDVTPCEVFSGVSQRGSKQCDFFKTRRTSRQSEESLANSVDGRRTDHSAFLLKAFAHISDHGEMEMETE